MPFRLLLFAGALLIAQGIAESVVSPLFATISRAAGETVSAYEWVMLAGTLGAVALALRVVDDGEWSAVGLGDGAWRPRALGIGFGLGALAIGITTALLAAGGFLHFVAMSDPLGDAMSGTVGSSVVGAWWEVAARLLVLLAPAALWEELVFRGYLWTVAEEAAGTRVALLSTSVAFGLVHLWNPGANFRTTLLVALAGVCLGLLRARTGSLPAAWAAHLAWNWIMGAVLHVPVSGLATAAPGYRAVVDGPSWLTGGAWGPEGGAIAALVLGGSLVVAQRGGKGWSDRQLETHTRNGE